MKKGQVNKKKLQLYTNYDYAKEKKNVLID